jgi:hypothetical protein
MPAHELPHGGSAFNPAQKLVVLGAQHDPISKFDPCAWVAQGF